MSELSEVDKIEKPKKSKKFFLILTILFFSIALGFLGYWFFTIYLPETLGINNQETLINELDFPEPEISPTISEDLTTTVPTETNPSELGTIFASIYIPKLSESQNQTVETTNTKEVWARAIIQGVELAQLDTMALGHFPSTAAVGQVGNFSLAAHRGTFRNIDTLESGDHIIVRTKSYFYIYQVLSTKITDPDDIQVIDPNPYQASNVTDEEKTLYNDYLLAHQFLNYDGNRFLTITTCHPNYTTDFRFIVHAYLLYFQNINQGIPPELK